MSSNRRGELIRRGRQALGLSRSNSAASANTDDDSENSRCPSPLLTIEGGYRIDPFRAYPVMRASRGVKFMADYYIQVWAPQQAQASSVQNGRNTLLAVVLPLAFRSTMLFEATIAMTRAAWVMRRGSEPFADKMMLRHRGTALKDLRNSFTAPDPPDPDIILLTMSTLLTLNYMINDLESFEVHLHALENMLASSDSEGDSEIRAFVRGRVLAFGVMASFLQAHQPSYATRINEKGHRISTLTYPGHPFSPELCTVISKLPEGFAEVSLSRSIAVEIISFLVKVTELVNWIAASSSSPSQDDGREMKTKMSSSPSSPSPPPPRRPDVTMQRAIYDLQCLLALPLTPVESQMVRALLAFCLHLYNDMSFHIPLARPLRPLLEAFNEPYLNHNHHNRDVLPRTPWLQRCLYWCAIVTASAWDTQIDASPEPHPLLDYLVSRLPEARNWEDTADLMRKFIWVDALADEWEVCWRAAAFRCRRSNHRRGASQIQIASISHLLIDAGGSAAASQGSETPSSEGRL